MVTWNGWPSLCMELWKSGCLVNDPEQGAGRAGLFIAPQSEISNHLPKHFSPTLLFHIILESLASNTLHREPEYPTWHWSFWAAALRFRNTVLSGSCVSSDKAEDVGANLAPHQICTTVWESSAQNVQVLCCAGWSGLMWESKAPCAFVFKKLLVPSR